MESPHRHTSSLPPSQAHRSVTKARPQNISTIHTRVIIVQPVATGRHTQPDNVTDTDQSPQLPQTQGQYRGIEPSLTSHNNSIMICDIAEQGLPPRIHYNHQRRRHH